MREGPGQTHKGFGVPARLIQKRLPRYFATGPPSNLPTGRQARRTRFAGGFFPGRPGQGRNRERQLGVEPWAGRRRRGLQSGGDKGGGQDWTGKTVPEYGNTTVDKGRKQDAPLIR